MAGFILLRDTLVLLLYILTSFLSLIANGIVCRISFQRRHTFTNLPLRTTYIYLLNLAFADALTGLTIPAEFLFCSKYFLERYSSSSYLCVICKSIQILGYNTSTLTMCAIALDRYRLVKNPFEQCHRRRTSRLIYFAWIFSSLFSASCLISMKVHTYFHSFENLISCQILFPITMNYFSSNYIRKIRTSCLILFFHIIPFLIISILCFLTIRSIAHRSVIGVQQFRTFQRSRTRSIRLLMINILLFTFSHLPINILYLRDFFFSSPMCSIRTTKCTDSTVYLLFYWLSISSSCHNPIIYSWFNRKYRSLVLHWYRSIFHCQRLLHREEENFH